MKKSSELEKQIAAAKAEQSALWPEADKAIDDFVVEIQPVAIKWIDAQVQLSLNQHSRQVASMNDEQLKAMKAKITDLKNSISATAKRAATDKTGVAQNPNRDPKKHWAFEDVFKQCVTGIGQILFDNKILVSGPMSGITWEEMPNKKLVVRTHLGSVYGSLPSMNAYQATSSKWSDLSQKIYQLEAELLKVKAIERFDSA